MGELLFGGGGPKKISKGQMKKMLNKMQQSYRIGDKLKKIGEEEMKIESKQADEMLEEELKNLD